MKLRLLAAFATLQVLDVFTTWAVVQSGGREANPLIADLVHNDGLWLIMLGKLLLVGAVALLLRKSNSFGTLCVKVVVALYTLIVLWNTTVYLSLNVV